MHCLTRRHTLRHVSALLLAALALPSLAIASAIVQPQTRAEYESFKEAQSKASNHAYRAGDGERTRQIETAVLAAARKFGDRGEEASSIYGLALAARSRILR